MSVTEITRNKFIHIYHVLSSENFLSMNSLNGEIPFWIAPYEATTNNQVEIEIKHLEMKLLNNGITPLTIDLFKLSCEIVDANIGMDKLFQVEVKKDKERFRKALQSTINIHERLIPKIVELISQSKPQFLLIKGVGSVYPFIRSHTVLNNLQSAVKDIPTLMFFPGEYSGQSLNLFGLLKDDNYYRAFNIDNFKL
jgi:Domain of unknown function (DUF1788)